MRKGKKVGVCRDNSETNKNYYRARPSTKTGKGKYGVLGKTDGVRGGKDAKKCLKNVAQVAL